MSIQMNCRLMLSQCWADFPAGLISNKPAVRQVSRPRGRPALRHPESAGTAPATRSSLGDMRRRPQNPYETWVFGQDHCKVGFPGPSARANRTRYLSRSHCLAVRKKMFNLFLAPPLSRGRVRTVIFLRNCFPRGGRFRPGSGG